MEKLDYCPFCGNGADEDGIGFLTYESRTLEEDGHVEWTVCVECRHCMAQSGHFGAETKELAAEQATNNWNEASRPNTTCHKVKRFFVQLEYDVVSYWYKLKNWDF